MNTIKIPASPLPAALRLRSTGERTRLPLFRTISMDDWRIAIARPKHNAVSQQIRAAVAKRISP